jgi:hypothetical protein
MRVIVIALITLLAACSSEMVRCEKHLTPINPPQKLLGDAAVGPKGESAVTLRPGRVSPQGGTAKKVEVHSSSGKSHAMPPAGPGGAP